jgi:hypothetical protein
MRTRVHTFFAFLAPVAVFALLGWILYLHGTAGLVQVEIVSRFALIAVAALGLSPAVLVLIGLTRRSNPKVRSRLRAPIVISYSAGILVAILGFGYIAGISPSSVVYGAPLLAVATRSGSYGIPDVAVVVDPLTPGRQTLTWGTSGAGTVLTEDSISNRPVFMLRDLKPATEYWYRLNDGTAYRFSTPDTTSRPLHFAVGSDAHFGVSDSRNDLTAEMVAQIASPAGRFNYFFSLGDNVEFGFRPEQWASATNGLSPATSIIPSVFAAGNHDTLFTGLARFLHYSWPAGIGNANGTRLWHRFDVGNVHFIVLDLEWSAETFTSAQAAWLEQELRSIPASDWTIVMNHGFYYGSGSVTRGWQWYDNPETINRITPLFERYGVDLVFSGHAHQMELLDKSGVTYVIAGAFGGLPDPPRTYVSSASRWYQAGGYGYVDVMVDESSLVITFRDPDGAALKTTTLRK